MADIKKELMTSASVKSKVGESKPDFRKRLYAAVNKLEDADWEALSPEAQAWANAAGEAVDAKEEIPDFDGVVGEAAEAADVDAPAHPVKGGASITDVKTGKVGGGKKKATAAPKGNGAPKKAAKKAKGTGTGRPRMSGDAVVKRKVKELPEGNRNKYWSKVPDGTKISKISGDKTLVRVTRYWKRKGFVEIVQPKA